MNISTENYSGKNLRIGILTHDFLALSGARDLLRMIIRGLKLRNENQFFLLMEESDAEVDLHYNLNTLCDWMIRKVSKYAVWKWFIYKVKKIWKDNRGIYFFTSIKVLEHKAQNLLGRNIIRGLKIIPYRGNELNSTIIKRQIDVVIPTLVKLPIPFVSYLYDCQHKYFPEYFSKKDIFLRDKLFHKLIESSCSMIVNSKDTKNDLVKYFRVDEEIIVALPFAPQLEKDVLEEHPRRRLKYYLPSKYFMISNQFWIHKSLETALKALRLLINEGLNDCHIVFTGKMEDSRFPEYVPRLLRMVKELKLGDHTTFLGYIPKRDQLEIMKYACAVIQTTLFEGGPGGGAVYDAVSLGVRTIVSNIPVNRELPISENVVLFEPKNIRDLADKMIMFWTKNYIRPDEKTLIRANQVSLKAFSDALYDAINLSLQNQQKYKEQFKLEL
jgi:glycosyltransferase involved in cell wall biosynthesis